MVVVCMAFVFTVPSSTGSLITIVSDLKKTASRPPCGRAGL
jgi:hypothetical protein